MRRGQTPFVHHTCIDLWTSNTAEMRFNSRALSETIATDAEDELLTWLGSAVLTSNKMLITSLALTACSTASHVAHERGVRTNKLLPSLAGQMSNTVVSQHHVGSRPSCTRFVLGLGALSNFFVCTPPCLSLLWSIKVLQATSYLEHPGSPPARAITHC